MSEWVDIPLATSYGDDPSSYVSDVDLVNLMLRENPPGSRTPFHIESTPSLYGWSGITPDPFSTAPVRGLCVAENSSAEYTYVVKGTGLYYGLVQYGSVSWNSMPAGTMPGTNYCRMVDAGTHVVVVNGTNTRCIPIPYAGVITTASREDFSDVAYQDGYTLYTQEGTDRLYASAVGDPATISATDYTTVDALPGDCVGLISDHREVFVFKRRSIEHYYNAGGSGFPFVRSSPGVIEKGVWLYGKWTISKIDNSVLWVGDDLRVYQMRGYVPEAISNQWIERFLQANVSSTAGPVLGNAFYYKGVPYYMVSGYTASTTGWVLVCDLRTRLWHRRNSPASVPSSIPSFVVNQASSGTEKQVAVVATTFEYATNGGINILSESVFRDYVAATTYDVTRTITLPQISYGGRMVFMYELYLDMEKSSASGTCTLSWSDDGGTTYTSGMSGTITNSRVRFQRLGAFRQRIFKLTFSVNNRVAIMGCRARIAVGDT